MNIWDVVHRLVNHLHKNPFIVFTEIINQIEIYYNLILMVVETFSYGTVFSLDVFWIKCELEKILFSNNFGRLIPHMSLISI